MWHTWELLLAALTLVTVLGLLVFGLDDLFLDLIGLVRGLGPKALDEAELRRMAGLPEKRFAILVANWKEEDVIEAMVRGNVARIDYSHYAFFLGVYPNDPPTWEAARRLEARYPQVHVVVNSLVGPTSKGQLLNHMVSQVLASEASTGLRHDAFLLHDSEDLIHPLSLRLLNAELDTADFVQIPVFSLQTPYRDLVAGTYADEFAESHTKNLLARQALGAAVPSAGVGTAVSRRLVLALTGDGRGGLLNEATLTEDYQLGLVAGARGFVTRFACAYFRLPDGAREWIATREYFPHVFRASVRQKTRWVVGIAFQGWQNLGWRGSLATRYFLWRDRRGPLNAALILLSSVLALAYLTEWAITGDFPLVARGEAMNWLFALNAAHMFWRMAVRVRQTALIYGWAFGLLAPLRWPVANLVNCLASWHAARTFWTSARKGKVIAWVKTQHRLPAGFGLEREGEYAKV